MKKKKSKTEKYKGIYYMGIIFMGVGAVFAIAVNPGLGAAFIALGVIYMLMGANAFKNKGKKK